MKYLNAWGNVLYYIEIKGSTERIVEKAPLFDKVGAYTKKAKELMQKPVDLFPGNVFDPDAPFFGKEM